MELADILDERSIRLPLESHTKEDVLAELVTLLPSASTAGAREAILASVLEREGRMSTGIGQGIAIPHGKCARLDRVEVAFGIAREPIEFESLDGQPVRLLFLLVSPPEMTSQHIKALAQISRVLSTDGVREDLLGADSPERVRALLASAG